MLLFRMFSPVLPVIFLLFGHAVQVTLGSRIPDHYQKYLLSGVLGLLLIWNLMPLYPAAREARDRPRLYGEVHKALGRWLGRQTPPGGRIALSDIGQLGYFSGTHIIDLAGLTDPVIARSEGMMHNKRVQPGYILDQEPAFIVTVAYKQGEQWRGRGFAVETGLLADPGFQEQYPGKSLVYYKDDYSYWVFPRKDLLPLLTEPVPPGASRGRP